MRKVVEFDEFSRCCKYFKSGEDYGFECLHPEQEERETYNGRELGRCFSCSCPLGIEAEQEDYGAKDIDWDGECSDGIVPEGEYLLITSDETASKDEQEALFSYELFMNRYNKKWLDEHGIENHLVE